MPKETRCWPGYEPVKGKKQHEEGSCKPKAEAKLSSNEKSFRTKRDPQLDKWQKDHPGSPRKAAQHLHSPGAAPAKKKSASQHKTTAKRKTTN